MDSLLQNIKTTMKNHTERATTREELQAGRDKLEDIQAELKFLKKTGNSYSNLRPHIKNTKEVKQILKTYEGKVNFSEEKAHKKKVTSEEVMEYAEELKRKNPHMSKNEAMDKAVYDLKYEFKQGRPTL